MDCVEALRFYVQKIVAVPGVKVLLLDDATKEFISLVYSQSEILKNDVFLVESFKEDKKREKLPHVACVAFLRPTENNIEMLQRELQDDPKYKEYKLYFSNILPSDSLDRVASSDKKQLVKEVYEYYADYVSLSKHLFTFNLPKASPFYDLKDPDTEDYFDRTAQGILSVLLSMKKRPFIRYQKNSEACSKLAQDLVSRMDSERGLFDFRSTPTLLIIDRRDDPITPLLTQWLYISMIHEILGIQNNRVNLDGALEEGEQADDDNENNNPDEHKIDIDKKKKKNNQEKQQSKKKSREVTLNTNYDTFFNDNMFKNWGDLCMNIKTLVEKYQTSSDMKKNITSIDDIQKIVNDMPQLKKFAGEVEKHVSIVHELKATIQKRNLLNVSQLEQNIACADNHTEHLTELKEMLCDVSVSARDAFRLVMLYAIRYETNNKNEISKLIQMLIEEKNLVEEDANLVRTVLKHCGNNARNPFLFGEKSGTFKNFLESIVSGGIQAEKNVFTQHKPLLHRTLEQLLKGKLPEDRYPFATVVAKELPKEVIVFIVGGATYEEFSCIETEFNTGGKTVIIGGTNIVNSKGFINDMKEIHEGSAAPVKKPKRIQFDDLH